MYKDEKILVVGHELFLGKRLCARLQSEKVRYSTGNIDFRNLESAKKFFEQEKPTIVIHCDSDTSGLHYLVEQPGDIFFNSTLIGLNLQEAARYVGVKKFVNPISYTTYPSALTQSLKESMWWDGPFYETLSVIGLVRKNTWMNAYAYHKQYGTEYANLILPNIYGPEDYFDEVRSYAMGSLIMKMVEAKRNNKKQVVVWGSGKPVRDWLFVDDAVDALLQSIDTQTGIEPINIGTGKGIAVTELAETIARIAGYSGILVYDRTKPDGVPSRVMDVTRCREILHWEPSMTMEQGIQKTIDWYMNQHP